MMNMLKVLAGLSILTVGASVASAQNVDAVEKRRAAMRAIAQAGSAPFQMFQKKADFELAKVQAGLKTYQEEGAKLKTLFPDNSKTGGETDATAKIWTSKAEFDKAIDGFVSTAKSASEAIKDEASFRTEYEKVTKTCGSCHGDAGFAPKTSDSFRKMRETLEKQKK
jgi:cytochrome c556